MPLGGVSAGLLSALSFGAGDFAGAVASRRAGALVVVAGAHGVGLLALLAAALIVRPPFPGGEGVALGLLAGVAGMVGLAALYRGMSLGSMGLVAASMAAGWAGSAVSQGRDAVRVVGRTAVELPYGPIVRGEARWTPDVLDWGPAYEPHRHPAGAVIGVRLPLAPGRYAIEVDADVLPSTLPPPALKVIEAGREPTSVDLAQTAGERLGATFEVRERPDVTLVLLAGRPLIINEIRLVPSTLSAAGGPIP